MNPSSKTRLPTERGTDGHRTAMTGEVAELGRALDDDGHVVVCPFPPSQH